MIFDPKATSSIKILPESDSRSSFETFRNRVEAGNGTFMERPNKMVGF
jgi:hypothetical protein